MTHQPIEQWGHPNGSTLIRIDPPDALNGRCCVRVTTDFSEAFGLLRPPELIELANKILAEYGGVVR